MEGYIALGVTALIGVIVAGFYKKITNAVSKAELEKVEDAGSTGRKEIWLEVNAVKIELAKSEGFREVVLEQIKAIDHKMDKLFDLLEKKQNKE